MAQAQIFIKKVLWKDDFLFPVAIWLISRIFIWATMLLVAPHLPQPPQGIVPSFGWGVFDAWDSIRYRSIVTSGYEFINNGQQYNIAFFPLFPLIIRALMNLGLPFTVAGVLVNNLAFLAALYWLYFWVLKQLGTNEARWVIAVLAWCPLSLFGTVIYTEGLYLLSSTAALYAFDRKQYVWTTFWGALATATRPTGMALIPAFLIAAWRERRSPIAYLAACASAIGLLLFSLYCAINFADPIAFINAQRGWRPSFGFDWRGWLDMLLELAAGTSNWHNIQIKNLLHLLVFSSIVASSYILWRKYKQLSQTKIVYCLYAAIAFSLILADRQFINNLLNVTMVLGGGYFLWQSRKDLTSVTTCYGFCGIALLLASGGTISLSRLAYGIVPLSLALGTGLGHYPRLGFLMLGLFSILLARLAISFAQNLWVG
ncbi:mannosyltransferase family protein [Chlorogloeopsis sp. ULAP01]|uniref:mannosyltransferase family protein n=1 Tax=Chlorogloeopsis sp. ULAP01 TaxID=3056483 RepID=UPI0025AB2857|nr:mannosyltransferase family protein [Chlorogloeopsis sp. ULAP01]MDM9380892.1 mannosyltransferase family protein [Chlorogloeopsis sp. ULAP01]